MLSGLDWFPTLLAAAGDTTITDRLLERVPTSAGPTFKVHLDGYNQLDFLTGKSKKSTHVPNLPISTTMANWSRFVMAIGKRCSAEQKKPGGFAVWYEPLTAYRIPKLFNLRMDPYERADVASDQYDDWRIKNAYLMGYMSSKAASFLQTFNPIRRAKCQRVSPSIRS